MGVTTILLTVYIIGLLIALYIWRPDETKANNCHWIISIIISVFWPIILFACGIFEFNIWLDDRARKKKFKESNQVSDQDDTI